MARILIVEDDPDIRLLSKNLLELLGHQVDDVGSGEEAAGAIGVVFYEIVLSDLGLPGMDGWSVAALVKQRSPSTKVGLVSGWEVPPAPAELQARGVDFLLPKPFDLDQIERVLNTQLAGW